MVTQTKPSLFARVFRWEQTQRTLSMNDDGALERYADDAAADARIRRMFTTNADLTARYGAVYAATRKRSQMAAKAELRLMVKSRGGEPVDVLVHPALDALHRVNESLTYKQGFALIEQHKLAYGKAYWIKRRDRLGVPREFEIWDPETTEVKPRSDRPWVPESFRLHKKNGTIETVQPKDVVWFRHMIDPRNPLNGLSPIGAVRLQVDTGMEAMRYNQRFFDNDAMPAALASVKDSGPAELTRIRDQLAREHKGTDNSHRIMLTEGDIQMVVPGTMHKDMQFLEQMRYTREEVAAVFEVSPVLIGDTSQATKENLDGYELQAWMTMVNQVENTVEELNEFYVRPDFGEEYFLVCDFSDVAVLQTDRLREAQVDEIELRSGKVYINELRERDEQQPVPWGDMPVLPNTMGLLDMRSPEEKTAAQIEMNAAKPAPVVGENAPPPPRMRTLQENEDAVRHGWEYRLGRELHAIIAHFEKADARSQRDIEARDVDLFDWDWWARYGDQVMAELAVAYEASLVAANFVDTPLMPTHELAVRWARGRAGELLELDGRSNVVSFTRERLRVLVAETIEKGDSLRTLKNKLRADFAFSDSRADMIARTETASAQSKASIQAYSSNGFEGKEWLTAGDGQVCAACAGNQSQGAIPLHDAFQSGHTEPGAHPRCRCRVLAVPELPTRTVKTLIKDANGETVGVIEEKQRVIAKG